MMKTSVVLLWVASTIAVAPVITLAQTMDCNTAASCQECVVSRCAYTDAGTCLDSCNLADADSACFSSRTMAGQSAAEICEGVGFVLDGSDLLADDDMMSLLPDTSSSSNETIVITGDSHPCNAFSGCGPCLNATIECAWTANSCQPSCLIADAACYTPQYFTNMTGPEICAAAAEEEESTGEEGGATDGGEDTTTSREVDSAAPDVLQGLKIAFLLGLLVAGVMV